MDPLSRTIQQFREEFRALRDEGRARVVLVHCDATQMETVAKVLRAEEWQPDNKAPFLIFNTAYSDPAVAYKTMSAIVEQHYRVLRKGLAEDGIRLPEWQVRLSGGETTLAVFLAHLQTFQRNLVKPLEGVWVCWVPPAVSNAAQWVKDIQTVLAFEFSPTVRFLFAEAEGGPLHKPMVALGEKACLLPFKVDGKGLMDYFKKLSAPAAPQAPKPHPGTMPGSARPDVEPPPRRFGPKQISEDSLRAAIQAGTVPPLLLPSQGARLRELILEAASAAGENRAADALRFQQEARALCGQAGVKPEQALMTLVLACYHTQFKQYEHAAERYREAATLAEVAGAFPQAAQARLGHASLLLMLKQPEQAAQQYELAAEAALKGNVTMLRIEALRMAGTCHLQGGKLTDATRCWQLAVAAGQTASAGEIRNSTFAQAGASLVKVLREQRLEEQARSVEQLVAEVVARGERELQEVGT
jgi:hypothetical protein